MVRRKEHLVRRKECLAGHVWLATCKPTSPNPPSSSFQAQVTPLLPQHLPRHPCPAPAPWEAVSLCGSTPVSMGRAGQQPGAPCEALDPPGQQGHSCPLAAGHSAGHDRLFLGKSCGQEGVTAQVGLREQDTGRTGGC